MIKIEIKNNEFAREYNEEYNSALKTISDEIFQTEELCPSGYINVGTYRDEEIKKFGAVGMQDSNDYRNFSTTEDWFNLEEELIKGELSDYEKILVKILICGFYKTYVLAGPLGSGKSSTTNHVVGFIEQFIFKSNGLFININFNFNDGWPNNGESDEEINRVISKFKNELFDKLKVETISFLEKNTSKIDRFLKYISNEKKTRINFAVFYNLWYSSLDRRYHSFSPLQKANWLIEFIEKKVDIEDRIELLMHFFSFLKHDLNDREYILLCYDNIDQLVVLAQKKIFEYIKGLNQISEVKCLVPLRRATFSRIEAYLSNTGEIGARSYGAMHHHGPKIGEVLKRRIRYWKDNIDTFMVTKDLSIKFKQSLKQRLEYLYEDVLSNNQYGIISYLELLSGNSIRLGLSLANKLIVNTIIPYDSNSGIPNSLFQKSLLVSSGNNSMGLDTTGDGLYICHLFSLNQNFSLLSCRILFIVARFEKRSIQTQISSIFKLLGSFGIWSDIDIARAIYSLLYIKRPLIWSDQIQTYEKLIDFKDSNANLYITEIGFNYHTKLIFDLNFIQDALFSVHWSGGYIPANMDIKKDFERFDTLLKCLKEMYQRDKQELQQSWEWINTIGTKSVISLEIIEKITESVRRIFEAYSVKNQWQIDVLRSWVDFFKQLINDGNKKELKDLLIKLQDSIYAILQRL